MMGERTASGPVSREDYEALRLRLASAEERLDALRLGAADALVVQGPDGPRVYTLQGADHPYRLFVEQMREAALTLGRDGGILYCNARFRQLAGLPEGCVVEGRLQDFVEPGDRPGLQALIEQAPSDAVRFNCALVTAAGAGVPVQISLSALTTEGFHGLCVVITDLSEFYRNQSIAASERINRTILDQASDAMLICDNDGRVRRTNRSAAALFGQAVVGKAIDSLCGEWCDCASVFEQRAELRGVLTQYTGAGATFDLLMSAVPLEGEEGDRPGWAVTFTDVTQLKLAQDRLREDDRRKNEFLAMLAHEFRNPLAPILTAVEVLRLQSPDDVRVGRTRELIERQVVHLARLVDDLLDVSRITQGKINLRKERVDLASILAQAVELVRPFIEARRHRLTVVPPARGVGLFADPTRLVQSVANLLNNAAKYSDDGGEIFLAAESQGGEAVITVKDNGIGIERQFLPHVFDLFVQADQSLDRSQGGLGIGLSLVRHLVELHGGKVECRSEGRNRGSEFTMRIPLDASWEPAKEKSRAALPRAASRRVLVVDDNFDAADSLATLLGLEGHEVAVANDGPAALAVAPAFGPDVVLLDIGLPGMNGYEVAQRLRELPGGGAICLVAVTGYGQSEDRGRSLAAGFDHHLVKPVGLEFLASIIERGERTS